MNYGLTIGDRPSGLTRLLIYESEARRIAEITLNHEGIEVGGDLFGFHAPDGTPLVFVATGPGPNAQRNVVNFLQDPEYQAWTFRHLAVECRMFYLGDWHSHHSLGISEPSSGDEARLEDLARRNGWTHLCSVILETERAGRDYESGSRSGRQLASPEARTKLHDTWWNAFHWRFDGGGRSLPRRVIVDHQVGRNPFERLSDDLNRETLKKPRASWPLSRRHSAPSLPQLPEPATEPVPRAAPASASESLGVLACEAFKRIAGEVSSILPEAEITLAATQGGGFVLSLRNRWGQQVTCRVLTASAFEWSFVLESRTGERDVLHVAADDASKLPIELAPVSRRLAQLLGGLEQDEPTTRLRP
jgi:hypothetical protein